MRKPESCAKIPFASNNPFDIDKHDRMGFKTMSVESYQKETRKKILQLATDIARILCEVNLMIDIHEQIVRNGIGNTELNEIAWLFLHETARCYEKQFLSELAKVYETTTDEENYWKKTDNTGNEQEVVITNKDTKGRAYYLQYLCQANQELFPPEIEESCFICATNPELSEHNFVPYDINQVIQSFAQKRSNAEIALKNLKTIRDKHLAHNEKESAQKIIELFKNNPINYNQCRELTSYALEFSYQIIDGLGGPRPYPFACDHYEDVNALLNAASKGITG